HSHREFGSYTVNPLLEQIADVKQALARMERFQQLTGIPYDRIMIFPQGVAPERTFEALAHYNFLGTINAINVPMGEPFPTEAKFLLRPYTTSYGRLLSMSRYSAEVGIIPRAEVAINTYLSNPLLFYGHQGMFDRGITAFNEFADTVNVLQPSTRWASL